jgi:hypothetical protein
MPGSTTLLSSCRVSLSGRNDTATATGAQRVVAEAGQDNWDDLGQSSPPGRGITTTDNENVGPHSDFTSGSRFTDRFGGTSNATPTVAGVCALVVSANPSLPGAEVKQLLEQTADQDLSLVTDTTVNADGAFNGAGFSLWFGHGKVNASAAVRAAAAAVAADCIVDVEQEANLDIPDLGGSVAGAIWVEEPGTITDFRVRVDISHTFIGDLRVDLIAPDGTAVTLHNNTGGSADNLVRTYSVQETPALRSLLGKPAGRLGSPGDGYVPIRRWTAQPMAYRRAGRGFIPDPVGTDPGR